MWQFWFCFNFLLSIRGNQQTKRKTFFFFFLLNYLSLQTINGSKQGNTLHICHTISIQWNEQMLLWHWISNLFTTETKFGENSIQFDIFSCFVAKLACLYLLSVVFLFYNFAFFHHSYLHLTMNFYVYGFCSFAVLSVFCKFRLCKRRNIILLSIFMNRSVVSHYPCYFIV